MHARMHASVCMYEYIFAVYVMQGATRALGSRTARYPRLHSPALLSRSSRLHFHTVSPRFSQTESPLPQQAWQACRTCGYWPLPAIHRRPSCLPPPPAPAPAPPPHPTARPTARRWRRRTSCASFSGRPTWPASTSLVSLVQGLGVSVHIPGQGLRFRV